METIQSMKMYQQLYRVYVNTCHIYEVNDYMVGTSQSGLIDFNQSSWGQSVILLKSINKLLFLWSLLNLIIW